MWCSAEESDILNTSCTSPPFPLPPQNGLIRLVPEPKVPYLLGHLHVARLDCFEGLVRRVDGARAQLECGVEEGAHPQSPGGRYVCGHDSILTLIFL
jgi:hypothetical protein